MHTYDYPAGKLWSNKMDGRLEKNSYNLELKVLDGGLLNDSI